MPSGKRTRWTNRNYSWADKFERPLFLSFLQALNFLRMSARVDAVASRVQSAVTTKRVTSSMQGVVKAMDSAMKSMNLEKISGLMDKFEKEFEDLDVQTSVMEGAMNHTTATNVPQVRKPDASSNFKLAGRNIKWKLFFAFHL